MPHVIKTPIEQVAGLKRSDVQNCACCRKGVAHGGNILFYQLRLARFGLDLGAVRRQQGLEQMLGGCARLADVMSPDEDLARPVSDELQVWVCEPCSLMHPLAVIFELANELADEEETAATSNTKGANGG